MRRGRLVACVCLLGIFAAALVTSLDYSLMDALGPGPGFFPFWLSLLGAALSVAIAGRDRAQPRHVHREHPAEQASGAAGRRRAARGDRRGRTPGAAGIPLDHAALHRRPVAGARCALAGRDRAAPRWREASASFTSSSIGSRCRSRSARSDFEVQGGHPAASSGGLDGGDDPAKSRLRADRLRPGHADRRAARARAGRRHRHPHPAHLQARPHRRAHHAQRHLLWRHVRRHHHVGADQRAGRSGLGHHLFRRLSDGEAGPWRHRAGDCRHRLVHRRHRRHDRADRGRPAARAAGIELRSARVLRADAGRPVPDHRSGRAVAAGRPGHGGARAADRDGRHRPRARRAALHLGHPEPLRRRRLHPGGDGSVRRRRDPAHGRGALPRGDQDQAHVAAAIARGMAPLAWGDRARHRHRLFPGPDPRRRRHHPDLRGLRASRNASRRHRRNSARAPSRAWPHPRPPTMPMPTRR